MVYVYVIGLVLILGLAQSGHEGRKRPAPIQIEMGSLSRLVPSLTRAYYPYGNNDRRPRQKLVLAYYSSFLHRSWLGMSPFKIIFKTSTVKAIRLQSLILVGALYYDQRIFRRVDLRQINRIFAYISVVLPVRTVVGEHVLFFL